MSASSLSLRKLAIRYSHFFGAGVLSQLLGFLTFPILTRVLTIAEYGMLGLVTTTIFIAVALAKAGLSDGIIRMYTGYAGTEEGRTVFASTIMIRGILLAILTTILYALLVPTLVRFLDIEEGYLFAFLIMAAYLFIRPLNGIVLNVLKIRGKTIFLNSAMLVGRILSIGLSLLFLLFLVREVYGFFIGVVIAEYLLAALLLFWFLREYRIRLRSVSGSLSLQLITFGAPLLLLELSYFLLTYANRYMIVLYNGDVALGIFSVGYNLAMYLSELITCSLSFSIVPLYVELYTREGRAKTEEFLNKVLHFVLIAAIPVCLGYAAVSHDFMVTVASHTYEEAAGFSPIILISSLLLGGVNSILNAGLYLQKKTMTMLGIILVSLAVNIILNIVFLPIWGILGAAWATLISCAVAAGLTIVFSSPYITLSFTIRPILYYLVVSLIMYAVVASIQTDIPWLNVLLKAGIGSLIMAAGVLIRERNPLETLKLFLSTKETEHDYAENS
ncbi:MAG: oligosaccharide flippase family protein [Nitrospirota bacterium]